MQSSLFSFIAILALGEAVSIGGSFFDGSLFSYHPVCMALGYLLLMTLGILQAFTARNDVGEQRTTALQRHMYIQVTAISFICIAFAAIYSNKIRLKKEHFTTTHAKLGVAAFTTSCLTVIMGIGGFRTLGLFERLPAVVKRNIKNVHVQIGRCTWLLALFVMELGLGYEKMNKGLITGVWQGVLAVIVGCVGYVQFVDASKGRSTTTSLPERA